MEEMSDEQFIIEEERHKELLKSLRALSESIPKNDVNLSVLEGKLSSLEGLVNLLSKKEVNVEVAPPKVSVNISSLEETMLKLINEVRTLREDINNKPTEWEFEINRNRVTKEINYVTAKAK